MKFFDYQHRARRQTLLLIVLFALAITALVVLLNLIVAAVLFGFDDGELFANMRGKHWFTISLLVVATIGSASLLRWAQLQAGGKAIALSVGGVLVSPENEEFHIRRLLNIVEEVALASGVPVPPVYILPDQSINAFAAGYHSTDAVIGVTRGAIEKLDRDQLQGVIAHEFSHILNGDMRINIRMMAMLYGILFVGLLGRGLLEILAHAQRGRRTSRDANNVLGLLMLVAVGMIIIGYCGIFLGNLIKAAIARQREYLADASAVQFTRNPAGIGGALKKIAEEGSYIPGTASQEASHFFFGSVRKPGLLSRLTGLLASHPPIAKRIQRIDPYWRGMPAKKASEATPTTKARPHVEQLMQAGLSSFSAALPEQNLTYVRDPGLAPVLVYAMLLDSKDVDIYAKQERLILAGCFAKSVSRDLLTSLFEQVKGLTQQQLLTLIELSIPALKQMDAESYKAWLHDVFMIIEADKRSTVFEWSVYHILQEYLQAHFYSAMPIRERHTEVAVLEAAAVIMSALAQIGAQQQGHAEAAFLHACQVCKLNGLKYQQGLKISALNQALDIVKDGSRDIRARCLRAFQSVASYDQVLTDNELSMLRALALALKLPMDTLESKSA